MQKIIIYTVILVASLVGKVVAQNLNSIEKTTEWIARGSKPQSYEMGSLKNSTDKTQEIFTIRSLDKKINGFGNLMQSIKSDLYLGKTIKMSGYVKSKNVKSWAGLWMRIDYHETKVLAFDNMQNRGIKGTNDWKKYEIVLYVPAGATNMSYGVLMDGIGQIWFKDVQLQIVDDSTPETGITKGRNSKNISFEEKAKTIARSIEMITTEERKALKAEIEAINLQEAELKITPEKAKELKAKTAQEFAKNIENKVTIEEAKLAQLVQDKVDGKITDSEEKPKKSGTSIILGSSLNDSIGQNRTEINLTTMKVYRGEHNKFERKSKRTTSQFVFAFGLNNAIPELKDTENSDFRVWGSHFYEWGLTYNTRLFKNHNLVHAKYGFSVMYNNLRPTDNRYFVKSGNQTYLATSSFDLEESRLRNVYLAAPFHLEFDFTPKKYSKDGSTSYFRTHESIRLGIGGYAGVRIKSKQLLRYEVDGDKEKNKQKGDFNVSDFNYGLSTYIGYRATSLYFKYDMNPLFKKNSDINHVKLNNVSFGIRWDFN